MGVYVTRIDMAKQARWIAIIASLLIACTVQAAARTKPAVRRAHARNARASYRAVRYRPSASHVAHTAHASTSKSRRTVRHRYSRRRHYHHHVRLPKGPTPERISQIQSALARGGYYQGDPTGKWDADTVAAVQKFQSSNNLDVTGKLDAPTLQKLGLGSDIAGVAAPRPVVPKACCAAPNTAPAPAVPAKPTVAPNPVAAGRTQPVASAASSQSAAAQPGAAAASTSASAAAAPAASSDGAAADPAAASKPAAQH